MAGAVHAAAQIGEADQIKISRRRVIGFIVAIAVPVFLWFAPLNFPPASKHALAVAAFMIVTWIAEPIPHAFTGL
jgi:di/tricarboxylate transporter